MNTTHIQYTAHLSFKQITVYPDTFTSLLTGQKCSHNSTMRIQSSRNIGDSNTNLTGWAIWFTGAIQCSSVVSSNSEQ